MSEEQVKVDIKDKLKGLGRKRPGPTEDKQKGV